jgi:transposase
MAMGRRSQERQDTLFIATDGLAKSPGHPFYQRLNTLLAEAEFDRWIEGRCGRYYATEEKRGQPSIPPGVYFRMLLVGYFEGIGSQRGIAWRCADSLSLRQFLGLPFDEPTPDHSTLTNTRNRLPQEVFEEVFQFVLQIAAAKKLLSGKTVGVDSTTLEADAAMKSIVRRDTGEDWKEYVTRLMREDGTIEAGEEPSDEEIRRYDKKRKNKRVSNEDWVSSTIRREPHHPAQRRPHAPGLQGRARGRFEEATWCWPPRFARPIEADTETLADSVMQAQNNLNQAGSEAEIEEVAADKGYHAAATVELCQALGLRTYIPEPRRPHRLRWTDKLPELQQAVYANRRRIRRAKSKRWQRLRK